MKDKCHQYWPEERSARYQYFVVDPLAQYNMPLYVLREFKVTDARVSLSSICYFFIVSLTVHILALFSVPFPILSLASRPIVEESRMDG